MRLLSEKRQNSTNGTWDSGHQTVDHQLTHTYRRSTWCVTAALSSHDSSSADAAAGVCPKLPDHSGIASEWILLTLIGSVRFIRCDGCVG